MRRESFLFISPQSLLRACRNSSCVSLVITYFKKIFKDKQYDRNLGPFHVTSLLHNSGEKRKKNVINGTAKSEATSDLHCALCDPS